MNNYLNREDIESIKEKQMELLAAHDPKALKLIERLRKIAIASDDIALLGYAYYRYAYYYYFADKDLREFRNYIQLAIKYLLRSGDKEYLGGTYNLVAYDAQDMGFYDVAYSYFMIAVRTSEQVDGISLPSLIEASAGRLLLELGEYRKGRQQLRKAVSTLKKFTSSHVYNYNMIVTYADEALASFKLNDINSIRKTNEKIEKHYSKSTVSEIELSRTYYLLSHIYLALLENDDNMLDALLGKLLISWKELPSDELMGLIYEIESISSHMFEQGQLDNLAKLFRVTDILKENENLSVSNRYYALKIRYYEQTENTRKLRKSLMIQHRIRRKLKMETIQTHRYAMDFSDMIENIAKEREKARRENVILQHQANTDSLTGLFNRNAMNKQLSEMFDEAKNKKTTFCVGILDVDNFKLFNDTYGHQAGDECLRAIGRSMMSFAEDKGLFCARFGGDEFIIGNVGLTDAEIRTLADELDKKITQEASRPDCKVYISHGVHSGIPHAKQKLWDYLSLADQELYKVKGLRSHEE